MDKFGCFAGSSASEFSIEAGIDMNINYADEIWSLYQNSADARSGMAGYGVGFTLQREYYQKLPEDGKRKYEQAVLVLCQSDEIGKAKLALSICSQLADVFPESWAQQVTTLVENLSKKGLQPVYTGTVTYAVLALIHKFNIYSLVPFVKVFGLQITRNLKEGALPISEWQQLYNQVSRILIKVAPDDFWEEFHAFYRDTELLDLLGEQVKGVTFIWASFGGALYGLDWLSKLGSEYSKLSDSKLKAQALEPIEKSSTVALINHPSEKKSIGEFLIRLKRQLSKEE